MKKILLSAFIFNLLIISTLSGQINLSNGLVSHYEFDSLSIKDKQNTMDWSTALIQLLATDRFNNPNGAIKLKSSFMPVIPAPAVLNMPAGNSARSLSIWFNLSQLPASGLNNLNFIFYHGGNSTGSGFGLALGNNQIYFIGYQNDLVVNTTIPLNQWNHLAGTYDGTNAKLYLNGTLVGQGNKSWNTPASIAKLGYFNTSTISTGTNSVTIYNNFFTGALDDFRIYSRAISAQEVTALSTIQTVGFAERTNSTEKLRLYPNPVKDNLTVSMPSEEGLQNLFIYNLEGKKLIQLNQTSLRQSIDVSELPNGIYWIRSKTMQQSFIKY